MKFLKIFKKENIKPAIAICKLKIGEHKDDILVKGGLAVIFIGGFFICKSILSIEPILDNHKKALDEINATCKNSDSKEVTKAKAAVYARTVGDIFVKMAPGLAITTVGTASVLYGYGDKNASYKAATAALGSVMTEFRQYQQNVINDAGMEKHLEYKGLRKLDDVVETTEDGEEVAASAYSVSNINGRWCRMFDERNKLFTKNAYINKTTLLKKEEIANEWLCERRIVYFNEVLDLLEFPRSIDGWKVGWIFDPSSDNPLHQIDFGIFNVGAVSNADFVNERASTVFLDFNVQGPVEELAREMKLFEDC